MFKFILIFGLCVLFSVSANTRDKRQAEECYTPENEIGDCVSVSNCQYLSNLYEYAEYENNPQTISFLKASQKNCGDINVQGQPIVCCGQNRSEEPTSLIDLKSTSSGVSQRAVGTKKVTECTSPDGVSGICKGLSNCRPLLNRLAANPQDSSFARYLRLSNEVCRLPAPTICCPTQSNSGYPKSHKTPPSGNPTLGGTQNVNRIPTAAEGCGFSKNEFRKIVGGNTATVGAWPWIALIGYTDSLGKVTFKCGGVLITQRHVLTAAHCIRTDLAFVRLGEHDLRSETETASVDINIVKNVTHPSYSRKDGHSDIGMLGLERVAPFTDLIRPICLPTPRIRAKSYLNYSPFVAGWGRTQQNGKASPILQELQVPIQANEVCADIYKKLGFKISERQFDEHVLCAGVLAGGKDTCQGDSGGPLMIPESYEDGIRFYALGIISYGSGCAKADVLSIYTSVSRFMPWIEKQIADNS